MKASWAGRADGDVEARALGRDRADGGDQAVAGAGLVDGAAREGRHAPLGHNRVLGAGELRSRRPEAVRQRQFDPTGRGVASGVGEGDDGLQPGRAEPASDGAVPRPRG